MFKKLSVRLSLILIMVMVVVMAAFTVYLVHDRSEKMNEMILNEGIAAATTGATVMGKIFDSIIDEGFFTTNEVFDHALVPIDLPKKITDGYKEFSKEVLSTVTKYHYATALDPYLDNVILEIEDQFLKDPQIEFAVLVDVNGYLPTHNSRYSKPLTGEFVYDRDNNRTKRVFDDEVGLKAAKNFDKLYLRQVYKRDTGEIMWDISSPVFVKGRHWGAFRVGFSMDKTAKAIAALRWKLIFSMGILLVITVLVINRVTAFMMRPLQLLHRGVEQVAKGDLSYQLKVTSDDEVGDLAKAFNKMTKDLKIHMKNLKETTAAKERIESKLETADTILTNMRKVISQFLGGLKIDYSFGWLAPYMVTKEKFVKGEILFKKGDKANKMFYIQKGSINLMEINKTVGKGNIIGEMGILSPDKKRFYSAICEEDLEIYTMSQDEVIQLFYQKPSFIFELVQLSIKRFIENLKETVAAKERIESELRIATDIQASMLPRIFPPFPERKEFDIFATMEPAKEVGGDFYDFFLVDENKLCFLIGDVSGKGVPASLFMVISKTLLKTEALQELPPDEILYHVNNILYPDNDACMFFTGFCVILNTATGEIQFANAGHNPPLICADGGDFEFIQVPKGFVVGPIPDTKFESKRLTLKPNDIVFLYTDGVTEAMNPESQLFSDERLKQTLADLKEKDIKDIIHGVRAEIEVFAQGTLQSDDITMLALKFNG